MRQLFKKVSAFAFAVGALLAALPLSAQVATNYNFSQTTGTYTPITGGTVLVSQTTTTTSNAGSLDDGAVYTLAAATIPFTFTYDGVGYTGLTVGNNGSLSFGATPMTANTYGALSTTTAYAGAVAAYSRDLQGGYVFSANRTLASTVLTMGTGGSTAGVTVGSTISGTGIAVGATVVSFDATSVTMSLPATSTGTNTAAWVWNGEIRYETVGVSPNQEFVIQWSNMKPFGTTLTTVNGFRMNMQVRLKEIDNSVEIHYGDCTPGAATSTTTAQVGLRGPNNTFATNVNNRLVTSGANDWAASLPGATNASACRLSATAPANVLASGTVYRWFDPPCAAPIANVTTGAPNCATNQYTATVNLTSLGDAPNVDIISSVNGLIADDVVALAAYPSAPVALGTPESFTVVHNGNALCNISLGPVNVLDGDNTCHAATVYPVSNTLPTRDVTFCMTDPGTSLGVDVFVQSVELVIAHTWNDDMDIQLINPNGTIVNLVNDRFGSGDNLGVIAGCATKFVLQDGGLALTNTNTNAVVGTWNPEQPLTTLHDASNPNGAWILRVTDDTGGDDGSVRWVKVNLTACPDPVIATTTAPVPNCATSQFSFDVNVADAGPSTVNISTDVHGVIHSGVGVGIYAVPGTAFGTPVTVTVTSTSVPACSTTLSPVVGNDADNVCHPATSFPVSSTFPITNVPFCVSDPGTTLGTDVYVQSVDLIISHTWNDDMDIQLINPNGTIVNLVNDRFGSGDNLGNPALCPGGLFTLAAGGAALNNTITNDVVGTFTPEQPLSTLHDASNPNGTWTLRVTDDTGGDDGGVRFVRVNLVPCVAPAATTTIVPNCAGANNDFSVDVNLTSMGTATSIDIDPSIGATVTAVAPGLYTVGPFVSGSSVTIDLVHNLNALCNVTLGPVSFTCPPDNDDCVNAIAVACNSVTAGTTLNSVLDAVPTCNTALNTAGGVWYTFVGTGGNTTVSLCGSTYDTKVGVFTTPDCVTFTCIEGNDDDTDGNGLDVCTNDLHSSLEFVSTLGQTYHVLVTGFSTNTGNFILEITCGGDGACNDNGVVVDIHTDNFGSETSWEIVPVGNTIPVCSGSGYADNDMISIDCCLIDGCYTLAFFDSFNDGMCCVNGTGGYMLSTDAGKRIIDNTDDGQFTGVSSVSNGFCLPIGATQLTVASCDKEDYLINDVVVSGIDPNVSLEYGVTDATSGYQFWLFNPDGGYSRRLFRSHASGTCVGTPAGPTRAAHMKFSCLNSVLPNVPLDVKLNMRVRPRVAGVYGEFGPACRVMVLSAPLACPTTQLDNNALHAGTTLSCNVTGKTVGASGYPGKLYPNIVAGANKYQYEFVYAPELYTRTIATATGSYALTLNNWVANPLLCGTITYDVRVRVSFDAGANWCPWGPVCTVEITNNPPNNCTSFFQGGGGNLNSIAADNEGMSMWPNPTRNGNVTLELNGLDSEAMVATMDMFDLFGKKVMSNTLTTDGAQELNTVFNTNDLAAGMYTVNVISGSRTFTSRLVIE